MSSVETVVKRGITSAFSQYGSAVTVELRSQNAVSLSRKITANGPYFSP